MNPMTTSWGDDLLAAPDTIPWPEHPRPLMRREDWRTLNGPWAYAVTPGEADGPGEWAGEIRVPFAIESKLSGVGRLLEPGETLWYERSFELSEAPAARLRLHFDAVDHDCRVLVNGREIGSHRGGNLPFFFDVEGEVRAGENTIRLAVRDETGGFQLGGKQRLEPQRIYYTRVSGIWQSVWLEWLPAASVERIRVRASIDGRIRIEPTLGGSGGEGMRVRVAATLDGEEVATAEAAAGEPVGLAIASPRRWSPGSPTLYGLRVELLDAGGGVLDAFDSYTGLREVGTARDATGRLQLTLNGEPVFHWGPLDQGWWPDGLLTPPSVEALVFDVAFTKAAGFNTIRKHVKAEPAAFYEACDRLGVLVWQDQPSGGPSPDWTEYRLEPETPVPGESVEADWPEAEHAFWVEQWRGLMDRLDGHPSVVVWVPFNERWGQHETAAVAAWTAERDPSRLVNAASGGNFFPVGDLADAHTYPEPWFDFDDPRYEAFACVVGEFGGHGLPVPGHLWKESDDNWGYGGLPASPQEWAERYRGSIDRLAALRARGLTGAIYTQTTDVEGEINGLLTYDRRVKKMEAAAFRRIHEKLGPLDSDRRGP